MKKKHFVNINYLKNCYFIVQCAHYHQYSEFHINNTIIIKVKLSSRTEGAFSSIKLGITRKPIASDFYLKNTYS